MIRTLRCVAAVALLALAATPLVTSCAQQAEGERCDLDKGLSGTDSDCGDGLSCTDPSTLQHSPAASVCCPTDGSFTTLVCTPKQGGSSSSASTSTSSASGSGGAGGSVSGAGGTTTSGSGGQGGATTTAATTGAGGSGGA